MALNYRACQGTCFIWGQKPMQLVEYLIISISNYSMLNVNNCNNFHNRGSCKFHKGNWLHTVEQRARGILYKLQIHENLQFELSIKEIQFSLKHYLHNVYIQLNDN